MHYSEAGHMPIAPCPNVSREGLEALPDVQNVERGDVEVLFFVFP